MRVIQLRYISIACVAAFSTTASAAPKTDDHIQMLTVNDPGRPFEIVDGICTMSIYPPITVADGFNQTLSTASKQLAELAKRAGANAVVGMQVSWETPSATAKGRVLICGTLIKYK